MFGDDLSERFHQGANALFAEIRQRSIPIATLSKEEMCSLFDRIGLEVGFLDGESKRAAIRSRPLSTYRRRNVAADTAPSSSRPSATSVCKIRSVSV